MSIGSFVVSLRVFLIDNVFSVCFTCILRWFFSSNKNTTTITAGGRLRKPLKSSWLKKG